MKKFSLKAFGASLLTLGLVLAGAAVPALASGGTVSTTTFTSGTGSPQGMTYTTGSLSGKNRLKLSASFIENGTTTTTSFAPKSTCNGANKTFAECGIVSVTVGGVAISNPSEVTVTGDLADNGQTFKSITLNFVLNQTGIVVVTFEEGAWTPPEINGTYRFEANTGSGQTFTTDVTVSGARSQVIFYQNLSSSDFTRTNQRASSPTALTLNTFTRTGYTFTGWSTTRTGSVEYTNGANFNFISPSSRNQAGANTGLYAIWVEGTPSPSPTPSTPSASLSLSAAQGQLVANSPVAIVASGLETTAAYTVVVRSTPQTIGTGNAVNGAVNTSVNLPATLTPGWHSLTFSSTASDGSPMTSVLYFEVSASGTLMATSSTAPASLANTGFDGAPYLAGGIALAVVGGSLMLIARRKATN